MCDRNMIAAMSAIKNSHKGSLGKIYLNKFTAI